MRLRTAFNMLCSATTGRLDRLLTRLDFSDLAVISPRHYVRLVWVSWILEIVRQRQECPFSES